MKAETHKVIHIMLTEAEADAILKGINVRPMSMLSNAELDLADALAEALLRPREPRT